MVATDRIWPFALAIINNLSEPFLEGISSLIHDIFKLCLMSSGFKKTITTRKVRERSHQAGLLVDATINGQYFY